MDKKEFFKITRDAFSRYGFKADNKYFYLDLPEVHVLAWLDKNWDTNFLCYTFSIKAIHENEIRPRDAFTGYDAGLISMHNLKGESWLEYEKMTEEDYVKILEEMLIRYFDPYKTNALEFIKKFAKKGWIDNKYNAFLLKIKAKEYLGIK